MVLLLRKYSESSLSVFPGVPNMDENVSASDTTILFLEIDPINESKEKTALTTLSKSALSKFLKDEEKYERFY